MASSSFLVQVENSNFIEALNEINSEIKSSGVTIDLVQAKIFCLINLKKFTLALSTIKMIRRSDLFKFEEAYCNYRLGKFISALNIISNSNPLGSKSKLLLGQVFYRLERFQEAADIFQDLIDSEEFPIEELEVNLLAALSQLKAQGCSGLNGNSFDVIYNYSLKKLASNDFTAAEQLANESFEKFSHDENVSQSDLINANLVAISALMNDSNNWPESEFLLRKLKASNGITAAQETLINANLMAISQKKNLITEFDAKNIEKANLFKSQKLQILANAHHFGFELEKSQLKTIIINSNIMTDNPPTKSSVFFDLKFLKADKSSSVKKERKMEPVTLDKERWIPLRDRSYFKTKTQYLKSQKAGKVNKK